MKRSAEEGTTKAAPVAGAAEARPGKKRPGRAGMCLRLFAAFFKIGAFTFGGGYAMIALLENECVAKKKWLTSDEMLDITAVAESTPGPIAINCATFTGHKCAGFAGAAAATLGVVLPSFIIILVISQFFEQFLAFEPVRRAFAGVRVGVGVLILRAGINMLKKLLGTSATPRSAAAIAAVFFAAVLALNFAGINISTVYLIIAAGFAGFCLYFRPGKAGGK